MNEELNQPISLEQSMTVDEIINELRFFNPKFPRRALEAAFNQKEFITPTLINELNHVLNHPDSDNVDWMIHLYALFLLAEFRETKAFNSALKFLELPEDSIESLLGDALCEDFPQIIASLYNGDLDAIKLVIENPSKDIYIFARDTAVRSLFVLVMLGVLDKTEITTYFKTLLDHPRFRDDNNTMGLLIGYICDFDGIDLETYERIEKIFQLNLVSSWEMRLEEVKDCLNGNYSRDHIRAKYNCYITNAIDDLSTWACFNETRYTTKSDLWDYEHEEPQRKSFIPDNNFTITNPIRVPKKPGRNDPCSCGSGKKYKKCCIN